MTHEDARDLVRFLQQKHPEPVSTESRGGYSKYCVGGIVCWWIWNKDVEIRDLGLNRRFPTLGEIASALSLLNEELKTPSGREAFVYASDITRKNDAGAFDLAWQVVEQALEYKRGSTK